MVAVVGVACVDAAPGLVTVNILRSYAGLRGYSSTHHPL